MIVRKPFHTNMANLAVDSNSLGNEFKLRPGAWAFETLWKLAGERQVQLNVPDTVILYNGVPQKWLATRSRILVQRVLPMRPSDANGGAFQEVSAQAQADHLASCFAAIRAGFLQYLRSVATEAGADRPFALVWFHDGRQEILKLGDYDRLVKEVMWTREVAALQPYTEAQSTHVGLFRRQKVRTGFDKTRQTVMGEWVDGNLVDVSALIGESDMHQELAARRPGPEEVNVALDGVTDRLAHALSEAYRFAGHVVAADEALVVDGGFSIASPEQAGATYSARSAESGLSVTDAPTCKQKVVSLTAHYFTSPDGRLWLGHVSSVYTIAQRQPQEPERVAEKEAMQLAAQEAVRTADEAETDLRQLVVDGLAHNLEYSQQFSHFDVHTEGCISQQQFADGLAELGIELPPAPLMVLWDRFAKTDTGMLSLQGFVAFFESGAAAGARMGTALERLQYSRQPATALAEAAQIEEFLPDIMGGEASSDESELEGVVLNEMDQRYGTADQIRQNASRRKAKGRVRHFGGGTWEGEEQGNLLDTTATEQRIFDVALKNLEEIDKAEFLKERSKIDPKARAEAKRLHKKRLQDIKRRGQHLKKERAEALGGVLRFKPRAEESKQSSKPMDLRTKQPSGKPELYSGSLGQEMIDRQMDMSRLPLPGAEGDSGDSSWEDDTGGDFDATQTRRFQSLARKMQKARKRARTLRREARQASQRPSGPESVYNTTITAAGGSGALRGIQKLRKSKRRAENMPQEFIRPKSIVEKYIGNLEPHGFNKISADWVEALTSVDNELDTPAVGQAFFGLPGVPTDLRSSLSSVESAQSFSGGKSGLWNQPRQLGVGHASVFSKPQIWDPVLHDSAAVSGLFPDFVPGQTLGRLDAPSKSGSISLPRKKRKVPFERFWFNDSTSLIYSIMKGPAITPGSTVLPYKSGRPVDLLYVPDLFEDISGLRARFEPLISSLPGSRLMIVHYPGLAGTTWSEHEKERTEPAQKTLNGIEMNQTIVRDELGNTQRRGKALSETLRSKETTEKPTFSMHEAESPAVYSQLGRREWLTPQRLAITIAACMTHARLKGEWGPSCAQDVIGRRQAKATRSIGRDCLLIGAGFGAHLAGVLATDILGRRSTTKGKKFLAKQDRIIASAVRAIILVNGFADVDAELSLVFERLSMTHGPLAALAGVMDSNRVEDAPLGSFSGGIPRASRRPAHIAPRNAPGTATGTMTTSDFAKTIETAASPGGERSLASTKDKFLLDGKSAASQVPMTKADRELRQSIGLSFRREQYNDGSQKLRGRGWGKVSSISRSISLSRSLTSSASDSQDQASAVKSIEELEATKAVRKDVLRLHEAVLFSPQYKHEVGSGFALAELWELNWSLGGADPFLDYGIARLSEAAFRHSQNIKTSLAACPFPVLFVAGSEDAFVLPSHSLAMRKARKLEEARLRGQPSEEVSEIDSVDDWPTFLADCSRPLHPKVQARFVDVPADMSLADFEALCASVVDDDADEETIADSAAADEAELLKTVPRHKRLPTQRLRNGRIVRIEDSVSDTAILGARPTFTAFLQGGHSLLQERCDDLIQVFQKVICGHSGSLSSDESFGVLPRDVVVQDAELLPPAAADFDHGYEQKQSFAPEQPPITPVRAQQAAVPMVASPSKDTISRQQAQLQEQLAKRGIDFQGTELEMLAILSEVIDNEDALNRKKAALAIPKEKRKLIEAKRRMARLKAMYKEKQRQAARKGIQLSLDEAKEEVDQELHADAQRNIDRMLMRKEDERSQDLRDYHNELAARSIEDAAVQAKLEELRSGIVSGAPPTTDAVAETVEATARANALKAIKSKMSKTQDRAEKAKEAAESMKVTLLGEAAGGYFLDSEGVQDLSVGSQRLLQDAGTLRSRKKAALRRWRRLDDRVKIIESELSKLKADLTVLQRAAVAVQKERDTLRRALSKHGQLQDKSSSILKTLDDELFEMSVRREAKKRTQKSLIEQLEVSVVEMDDVGSSAHAIVAKAKFVEDTLIQFRLICSQKISMLRDVRAEHLKQKEISLKQAREASSTVGRLKRKLKELVVELKRTSAVKKRYVDTYFFHPGYSQRIEASVLRKQLRAEIKKVKAERQECKNMIATATQTSTTADAHAVAAAEDISTLGRILAQVVESINSAPPYADDLKSELALDQVDEAQEGNEKLRDVAEAVGVDTNKLRSMPRRELNLVWRAAQLNAMRELNIFCEAIVSAEDATSLQDLGAEFAKPSIPQAFRHIPEVVRVLEMVLGAKQRLRDDAKLRVITRWKPTDDRSSEERKWVALDRKMNPHVYSHLGADEQKLLEADPLYQTPWPPDVLETLVGLPCSLSTALASMNSTEHMELHRLIAKYTHGYGEESERLRDMSLGAKAVACAAVARGFAARTKLPSMRSAEEQDWVALDKIYRPHLYVDLNNESEMDSSILETVRSLPTAPRSAVKSRRRSDELVESMQGLSAEESIIVDAVNGSLSDSELMSGASVRHRLLTAKRLKDSIMFDASAEEKRAAAAGERPDWEQGLRPSPRFNPAIETDMFTAPLPRKHAADGRDLTPRDAKSMFYRLMQHKFRRERRKKAELAKQKQEKKMRWLKRQAAIQAKALEQAEAQVLGGVTISDIRRRAHFARPPPGDIAQFYDRQSLHRIIWTRTCELPSARDRRVQMLLRAYGSDGGYSMARLVAGQSTPIVYGIPEIADAQKMLAEELREAGEVSVLDELAYADADGSRDNTAAVAIGSAQGGVLVRSAKSLILLDVKNAALQPGTTQEHVFEVPGSLSDVLAFGPRGWDGVPATIARLMGTDTVPSDVVNQPGTADRAQMLSAHMRGQSQGAMSARYPHSEFRPPTGASAHEQVLQGALPTSRSNSSAQTPYTSFGIEPVDPLTAAQQFNQRLATAETHTALPTHPLERVAFETAGGVATTHNLVQDGPIELPYTVRYEHPPVFRGLTRQAQHSRALTSASTMQYTAQSSNFAPTSAWTENNTLQANPYESGVGAILGAHSDKASAGAGQQQPMPVESFIPIGLGSVTWTELGAQPLHPDIRRELAGGEDPAEAFKREIRRQKAREDAERRAKTSGKNGLDDALSDEEENLVNDFEQETGCPGVRPMVSDLTAVVTFHGAFSGKSAAYVLAKVQAALYREAFTKLDDVPTNYHDEGGVAVPEDPHDHQAVSRTTSAAAGNSSVLYGSETPRTDRTVRGLEMNQSRLASRGVSTRGASAYTAPAGQFGLPRPSARSAATPRDEASRTAVSRGDILTTGHTEAWVSAKPGSAKQNMSRIEAGALFATGMSAGEPFAVRAWEDADADSVKSIDMVGEVGHPFVPISQTERYQLSNPNMAPTRLGTPEVESSEPGTANARQTLSDSLSSQFSQKFVESGPIKVEEPGHRRAGGYYGPAVDVYGVEQLGPDADKSVSARLDHSQLPPLARHLPVLDGVPADQIVACMRWPVGYSVSADCTPNTPTSIGKLVIRHEPMYAPVLPGRYAICIEGLTPGSYSVSVSASVVFAARDVLEGAVRRMKRTSKRVPECRQELNDIGQSLRLGQRKMHLVRDLVVKTEQELSSMSQRTAALRRALERGLVTRGDLGSDAEDEGLNYEEQVEVIGGERDAAEYSSGFSSSESEEQSATDSDQESSGDDSEDDDSSEEDVSESDSSLFDEEDSYSDESESDASAGSDKSETSSESSAGDDTDIDDNSGSESTSKNATNKILKRQRKRGAKFAAGKAAAAELRLKGRARKAGADRMRLKRMREQLPVSEHVRQLILKQLSKLDDRFAQFVRLLNLREDELVQIEDGLQALHQASLLRQQEMNQLLQRLREYKKHLPIALDAMKMKLGEPLSGDQGAQARMSLSTKLGFGKNSQVPGQQAVDEVVQRAYSGINYNTATAADVEYEEAMRRPQQSSEAKCAPQSANEQKAHSGDTTGYDLIPCSEHDHNMLLYGPEIVKFMIEARKAESETAALTPAQAVRRKPLHELTKEEKLWMSLDIVLQPEAYAEKMDDDSADELEELMETGVIVQQSGQLRGGKKLKLPPRSPAIEKAMKLTGEDFTKTPQKKTTGLSDAAKATYGHNESVTSPYAAGAFTSPTGEVDSAAPVAAEDIANLSDFDVAEPSEPSANKKVKPDKHQASKSTVFFALNKLQRNLPTCRFTRAELLRISTVPFQQLNQNERDIRKLLGKYHDNMSRVRANEEAAGDGTMKTTGINAPRQSTLQQLYAIQEQEGDSGSDNEERRGQSFVPQQRSIGKLKVHASSSVFMRAYAAVPIPQNAPQSLKQLLNARANELNGRWSVHMAKTLKGHGKPENMGVKTIRDLRNARSEAAGSQPTADAPSTVLGMIENVRGNQTDARPLSLNRVVDFSEVKRDVAQMDVDEICRDLLEELDRSRATDAKFMESSVLHGTEQRYETKVLIADLEEHLNRLLLAQVFERESIEAALIEEQRDMYRKAAANEANEQEKQIAAERKKAMERLEALEAKRAEAALAELQSFDANVDLTDDEVRERAELAAAAAALVQQREELKARMQEKEMDFGDGDSSVSSVSVNSNAVDPGDYDVPANDPLLEIGAIAKWGDPNKPITPRRAEKQKMQALIAREKARAAARNMAKGEAGSGPSVNAVQRRRKAELLSLLQEGVLVADDDPDGVDFGVEGVKVRETASKRLAPWKPSVPIESLQARLAVLNKELLRVRTVETEEIESQVLLSYLRGGNKIVSRIDAIFELGMEIAEIKNSLRLNELDKELHRGYSSTKEWMTTSVLHGTAQQVWRLNAIEALERQANRIVARQTAVGLVEDVLQWMLEGWHFGERNSHLAAQGFVPSLKQDGVLRPSEGGSKAAVQFVKEGPAAIAMATDAARGLIPAPEGSAFDANIVAAEDMIERDPRGDRFPFAHAAVQQDRAEQQMQQYLENQLPPIMEQENGTLWNDGTIPNSELVGETPADEFPAQVSQGFHPRPSSTALQHSIHSAPHTAGTDWQAHSMAAADGRDAVSALPSAGSPAVHMKQALGLHSTEHTIAAAKKSQLHHAAQPLDGVGAANASMLQSGAQLVSQAGRSEEGDVPDLFKAMVADETSKGAHGVVGGDERMPVEERWKNIHQAVSVRNAIRIAIKAYKKVDKTMDETERSLKYGIFCMTLLYFRNMSQVKEQQQILSGARDVAILEAGAGDVKVPDHDLTKERLKIRKSHKRRVEREQAMNALDQIASAGYERKETQARNRRFKDHMLHVERERLMKKRRLCSTAIQRIYRGFRDRKYVNSIRADILEAREQAKREEAAAILVQAQYRGYLARQYVKTVRSEMAAFMAFLRREEDKELETVYYMDNAFERYKKKAKDLYQSRVAKRREMARKMQRNLAADVVELEDGAVMNDLALEEAKEAAKDKEADPLANVTAKSLRSIGGDKTFFKLVTAEDLEKQTKSRIKRERRAQLSAQAQLKARASVSRSAKQAAALAAQQAAAQ